MAVLREVLLERVTRVVARHDDGGGAARENLHPAFMALRLGRRKELGIPNRQQIVDEEDRFDVGPPVEPAEVSVHPQRELVCVDVDRSFGNGAHEAASRDKACSTDDGSGCDEAPDRPRGADCGFVGPAGTGPKFGKAVQGPLKLEIRLVVLRASVFAPMCTDGINDRAGRPVVERSPPSRTEDQAAAAARRR